MADPAKRLTMPELLEHAWVKVARLPTNSAACLLTHCSLTHLLTYAPWVKVGPHKYPLVYLVPEAAALPMRSVCVPGVGGQVPLGNRAQDLSCPARRSRSRRAAADRRQRSLK